jgi:hypothetical protein
MDIGLIVAFAVIALMIGVALLEAVRVAGLNRRRARQAADREGARTIGISSFRLTLLVALAMALGIYFYSRYSAYAARDREIVECLQGRETARAMCEGFIDLRHRYD